MKTYLREIIKEPKHGNFGQEDQSSSFGAFIAGIVIGIAGSIFTMTLAIKTKPLTQKQIQEKINAYVIPGNSSKKTIIMSTHNPQKTILMRT